MGKGIASGWRRGEEEREEGRGHALLSCLGFFNFHTHRFKNIDKKLLLLDVIDRSIDIKNIFACSKYRWLIIYY